MTPLQFFMAIGAWEVCKFIFSFMWNIEDEEIEYEDDDFPEYYGNRARSVRGRRRHGTH